MYTLTKINYLSARILLVCFWKPAKALNRPNNISWFLKYLYQVYNAIFYILLS